MFKCDCGKEAKTNAGLSAHKRKCKLFIGDNIENVKPEESHVEYNVFEVVNPDGSVVRTYSLKEHGEKAEELAIMFSNKFNKNYVKTRR